MAPPRAAGLWWLAAVALAALRAPSCACGPNGVCSGGRCLCRSPWTGSRCERRAVVDTGHYYALLDAAETPPAPEVRRKPALRDPWPAAADGELWAAERLKRKAAAEEAPGLLPAGLASPAAAVAAEAKEGLERWGERARAIVGGGPPPTSGSAVESAPLQLMKAGDAPEVYEDTVEHVADFNEITRFMLDVGLIIAIVILIVLISFLIKHSGEVGARIFYLVSGDTRLRLNSMDMMGANLLPSTVIRIERIILHDIEGGESKDVFVEVDFGTNMLASTRVRSVQPVAAWSEPRVMQTLPEKDRPQKNRVVFTDKLEFNVRPFGEGDIIFRIKDQGMMGSELLGTLRISSYDVVQKAKANEYAQALNYSACLSFPLKPVSGRHSRARILFWVVLGDSY